MAKACWELACVSGLVWMHCTEYVCTGAYDIHPFVNPIILFFFFLSFIPWLGVGVGVGVGMDGWNTVGDAVLSAYGMEWNEWGGWMECWD